MYNYLLIELIKKFKNQDMTAFTLIYDNYKRLIYHFAFKTGDEDTTQELTLFLIELLYSLDISRFKPDLNDELNRYITVALRNRYIAISKELELHKRELNQIYYNEFYGSYNSNDTVFITEALNQLTLKQRLTIIYKYIYCMSDAEIALKLKVSRQAVNRLKNRGLDALKEFYREERAEA